MFLEFERGVLMRVANVRFGRCVIVVLGAAACVAACQNPDQFFRDGGTTGKGGSTGAGGSSNPGTGGIIAGTGGSTGTGGSGSGGSTGTGGRGGSGGSTGTGGRGGSGGSTGTGGTGVDAGVDRPPPPPGALKVHYTCRQQDNTASFVLVIENTKAVTIPLANITVRYWYTADTSTQVADCDYAKLEAGPCPDILRTIHPVSPARTGANNYLEFGFTSTLGDLPGFLDTGDIQIRLHNADYSTFMQADDYSIDCTSTTMSIENMKITAYVSGALVWGAEPM
jgi:endoglucanase